MRYSNYKKKMQRVRKVLDFFHRFRFVFIGIIIAITAPLVTLNITKGNITKVSTFEVSYTYGEGMTYSGSAFMGEVSFEFRKVGEEEWTEQEPRYVGQYEVRAKCKGNYGYKYSSVSTFDITPKEVPVTIKNDNINFGDDHPALTYELLAGDTLNTDYLVNYADLTSPTTTALLDTSTLKVTDNAGVDVTNCYSFTTEEKEISFNKATINIKFADNVVTTYDGNEYTNDGWEHTSGNLYYDAEIVVDNGITVSEIGTHNNEHRIRVMKGDVDYTANYDIRYNDNSIRIDKAPAITITTNSLNKVYDGKPFAIGERADTVNEDSSLLISEGEFNATVTGLLPIHHIEVEFTNSEQKNVISGISNEINYHILDKDNNDVKDRYQNVIESKGTMAITVRPITFKAGDVNSIYDATYQYNDNYEITNGKLADDEYEQLQDDFTKQLAPVVNLDNEQHFKIFHKVEEGDDIEVTSNYDVTTIAGKINIGLRPVTVTSGDLTVQYDNTEKSQQGYALSETTPLANGDNIELAKDGYTKQTTPVADLDNEHSYKIYHTEEDESKTDVTSYYDFTYVIGKITIFTKPLEFEFKEQTFEYDGKAHHYYDGDTDANNNVLATLKEDFVENLPEDFTYKVSAPKSLTMTNYEEDGYTALEKDITIQIFDAKGVDVAKYYKQENAISVDLPTSYITKKEATVTVEDYEKTYDNKTIGDTMVIDPSKANTKVSAEGLVKGHNLKVEYAKDDDTKDNKDVAFDAEDRDTIFSRRIALSYAVMSGTDNVTSNYDISFKNEKDTIDATITRRALYLSTADVKKTYDEKNVFIPAIEEPEDGYEGSLSKETGKEVETVSIVSTEGFATESDEVDTYPAYELDASNIAVSINGVDVTDNYDIYLEKAGKVTIDRRSVTISSNIKSASEFVYYDAKDHGVFNKDDGSVSDEILVQPQTGDQGLLKNHKVVFDSPDKYQAPDDECTYVKDALEDQPGVAKYGTRIENAKGDDVSKNYKIIHNDLHFKIKKNVIKIDTKDIGGTVGNLYYFDNEPFDHKSYRSFSFGEYYEYTKLSSMFKVTFEAFDETKPLQEGHKLMVTKYTEQSAKNAIGAGSHPYEYKAKVVDGKGNNVSELYTLELNYSGNLIVEQATVKVYCDGNSRNYDGLSFEPIPTDAFEVTEDSKDSGIYINGDETKVGDKFFDNFKIEASFTPGVYDPDCLYNIGVYTYTPDFSIVDLKTGNTYSGLNIDFQIGKSTFDYTISKRTITLVSKAIGEKEIRYYTNGSPAKGDDIYFTGEEPDEKLLNAKISKYKNDLENVKIIKDGEIDVTDCYSITYVTYE